MIKSICIIRLSALGDVLMLVPTVRAIQRAYPKAKITWVISRPAYDMVKDLEQVEFVVIEKPNRFKDYLSFKRLMKHRQFDVLLAMQASLRANLLIPCIKAKTKIGYDKVRANDGQTLFTQQRIPSAKEHTLEGFLQFAKILGIQDVSVHWDIPIDEKAFAFVKSLNLTPDKPLVLINPSASKPERSWAAQHYIELIKYLKDKWQVQVCLTGGPTALDAELSNVIVDKVSVDLNLVGVTKPKALLALIKQADLMICPDTGPSHMASAVSTPVIALHAVTNPQISGPYGSLHRVVNAYPDALKRYKHKDISQCDWGTQVHHPKAMDLVTFDLVRERVDDFFR